MRRIAQNFQSNTRFTHLEQRTPTKQKLQRQRTRAPPSGGKDVQNQRKMLHFFAATSEKRGSERDGGQPRQNDSRSTQGIFIPWVSEGLAPPLQFFIFLSFTPAAEDFDAPTVDFEGVSVV